MLNFIVNGQESIIQMLKDKILKLNYAKKYIENIESSHNLSKVECNILFIYIQTLRRHLDNLVTLDLITLNSKKPLTRIISNTLKEILD